MNLICTAICDVVYSLQSSDDHPPPFSGRRAFCEELSEKLRGGNSRLRKRAKAIKKQDTSGVISKLEGDFMALDKYEKDW